MTTGLGVLMGYDPHSPVGAAQRKRLRAALDATARACTSERDRWLDVLGGVETRVRAYLDDPPEHVPDALRADHARHSPMAEREVFADGGELEAWHDALVWCLNAIVFTRFGPAQRDAADAMVAGVLRCAEDAHIARGAWEWTARLRVWWAFRRALRAGR